MWVLLVKKGTKMFSNISWGIPEPLSMTLRIIVLLGVWDASILHIKNVIAQVHFDMEMAFKSHESLLKKVEVYEESFCINEIRFNNGVSNFINYVTSKNNLDNSKVNLTNSKYEYLLHVKVLNNYRSTVN